MASVDVCGAGVRNLFGGGGAAGSDGVPPPLLPALLDQLFDAEDHRRLRRPRHLSGPRLFHAGTVPTAPISFESQKEKERES